MLDVFKQLISNQYEAAFCTLGECVKRCPDEIWQRSVVNNPFSQSVFHTLFFADLYLGTNVEEQPTQPFHQEHASVFDDYEQIEDRVPVATYSKEFIRKYLVHCRSKAIETLNRENENDLSQPVLFPWLETSRAEVHVYNIRHIQHHAAQLIAKLRSEVDEDMPWVKSGWLEF